MSVKEKLVLLKKVIFGVLKDMECDIVEFQGVKKYFFNVKVVIISSEIVVRVI